MKKLILFTTAILAANLLTAQINIVDDSFYSEVLQQEMMVDVYLPPGYEANPDLYYPVIYFLHGWLTNQDALQNYAPTAHVMILNNEIEPFIMVCANNQAGPFGGTMYVNSPPWGDFETYNFTEVVDFIEESYRAFPNKNKRALMGQSMGGNGCFDPGISYKDKFRAIAAHGYGGVMELCLNNWQNLIINEQTSGPPYFYDFNAPNSGFVTKLAFLLSGDFSPNMNSPQTWIDPAIVEYVVDDQGEYIDTVLSKWLEKSGHQIVKELTPDDDFGILFGDGVNDALGTYPGNVALKDSLDAYGIPATFFSHNGGHTMPLEFKQAAFVFLDSIFNSTCSCLPEGITFTTQAQIDSFAVNYPGCTEIEGDVTIGEWDGSDITNLNGLSVLTSIDGSLYIGGAVVELVLSNPYLTSLEGLTNLSYIGDGLVLIANTSLCGLAGLESLTSIEGSLVIAGNDALTSLTGLDNISYIEGDLLIGAQFGWAMGSYILGNPSLASLTGLEGLTSIGGNLEIGKNDVLNSLSGLDNVTAIGGNLEIGIHTGNINFSGNPSLTSLAGLHNVTSIGGWLLVKENDALSGLQGLDSIDAGSITNLYIWSNSSLSICEVQSICDYLSTPNGEISIHDNAPGCNSPEELEEACLETAVEETTDELEISISPNPVEGFVFFNINSVTSEPIEISVYNISGICLVKQACADNQKDIIIHMADFSSGIYLLRIMIGNEIVTKKIIKQ